MTLLDARKCQVLRAVVEDYVQSAEPVGSRTVARRYDIGFSPATIRNEMADLEELGYLAQPHTSAGRVPSDKGYRFYVDRLMPRLALPRYEALGIRRRYRRGVTNLEWLLQETVRLLSEATAYTAVAMGPDPGGQRLKGLEIVAVGEGEPLLVLLTDRGAVHHRMLEIPDGMSEAEVRDALAYLQRRFVGLTVDEIGRDLLDDIARSFVYRRQLLEQVVDLLMSSLVTRSPDEQIMVGGTAKIVAQPEYQDVGRLRDLLTFLDRPATIRELLLEADAGVEVVIGEEHRVAGAEEMSLVVARLERAGGMAVRFGVLGPKRMDYGRVLSVIRTAAGEMDALLS